MKVGLWAAALGAAVLWPGRLAGLFDGAPLDTPLEAVVIGVALPALVWVAPGPLQKSLARTLIVSLLFWKAATAVMTTQDGWCLRFTSPTPLFVNQEVVPHSWDVRADWRSATPQCSAIMTAGYTSIERFPVWFYNLPPANFNQAAAAADRPPLVSVRIDLNGFLEVDAAGSLQLQTGSDMQTTMVVDGQEVTQEELRTGKDLVPGLHEVSIAGVMTGDQWRLVPLWNGSSMWGSAVATVHRPSSLDLWIRPWARFVTPVLIAALLVLFANAVAAITGRSKTLVAWLVMLSAMSLAGLSQQSGLIRFTPLALLAAVGIPLARRVQNLAGAKLLIGLPFLALVTAMVAQTAGSVTWYSSGDDWWMFQRYAYRIFMEGYWLEGGQPTFWFQPLYRWVAGSIHMIFGDSSVGEVFWDAACLVTGSCFAFHVTRRLAGFRWAVVAGTSTLAVMTLGPAWYLVGRGLSEITSMGFIYAAAMLALRGRHGHWPSCLAAGVLAVLAFYTRLNNLPMALAVALFALPVSHPMSGWTRPAEWIARLSQPVVAFVLGTVAIGLWLFTARTYYYTGVPSMLFGTQAGMLSVWQATPEGLTPLQNVAGSIAMVLSMNDPPRLDLRALPVIAGVVAALLGVVGVRPFNRLPLNAAGLCLAGMAGVLVARGTAYPGRFSVHIIPAAVALAVGAVALVVTPRLRPRSSQPAPQSPDTT